MRITITIIIILMILLTVQVFFLKAMYRGGEVEVDNKELVDHVWVTKEEMRDYVSPDYYTTLAPILLD